MLIFLLIAAVLYAVATVILIAWLWRRTRRKAEPKRSFAAKWTRRLDRALADIPHEDFKVFLYHYPGLIYTLADRGIDLHCAGHTHGGQVALPFYGAITTMARFGKRFEAGLYRVHNTQLYVNRGIGMEGGYAPRVRFWCRLEVSLLEIDNDNT